MGLYWVVWMGHREVAASREFTPRLALLEQTQPEPRLRAEHCPFQSPFLLELLQRHLPRSKARTIQAEPPPDFQALATTSKAFF